MPYLHDSAGGPTTRTHERERLAFELDGVDVELAVMRRPGPGIPIVSLHGFGSTKEDYADAGRAGFSPTPTHWARSVTSQRAMVASGLGVTIVPSAATTTPRPDVVIRPLLDMAESVALSVAIRADDEPLTMEFARRAQDIVRQEHVDSVGPGPGASVIN